MLLLLFLRRSGATQPPVVVQPERGATGGGPGARGHRYKVRVGRRWVEVDPMDAVSVQRAYALAEEAAQEAAERPVASPKRAAVRAVAAEPIAPPSVDYASLRAEAQRVSDMVRAVYAEALQRELIGRLMREQMERDDEDDIELLLTVV
jgi:hypothetical protein